MPNVTIVPSAPAPAPLIEGRDALVLDCDVDANPAPAISWYKDVATDGTGVPRLQEIERGPQLRLDTVNRHDAGVYTCIATNIIGESDRVDLPIDVHCKYPLDHCMFLVVFFVFMIVFGAAATSTIAIILTKCMAVVYCAVFLSSSLLSTVNCFNQLYHETSVEYLCEIFSRSNYFLSFVKYFPDLIIFCRTLNIF